MSKRPTKKPPAVSHKRPAPKAGKLRGFTEVIASPLFAKGYLVFAVFMLFATTLFWAIKGAQLQMGNADQLVNPYLFENAKTFHGALFPSQHTFLLKWPLFWLVKLTGFSNFSFVAVTVCLVLITVAGLAYLLYRIERRPLYIGTLLLGVSSVLLLIPAQPYAGGILPVNMAMLTTRNVEYLIYVAGLVLLIRYRRVRSLGFWGGVGLLGLLIASDKLFLSLSVGGALLALIAYSVAHGWKMVTTSVGWLIDGLVGVVAAFAFLIVLGALHATHIVNQSNATGPYQITGTVHNLVLGVFYAVANLFTNLGANPAFSATRVRAVPHDLLAGLFSLGFIGYLVNILLLLAGLFAARKLMQRGFAHNRQGENRLDHATLLSVMLVWSLIAAVAAFIITNHYYAVDARYLTIALFTVFVCLATWSRRHDWGAQKLVIAGVLMAIAAGFSLVANAHTTSNMNSAYVSVNGRNDTIAQVLQQHRVKALVGDYWRVLPIKKLGNNQQTVMPLQNCTTPRSSLSSTAWQLDLNKHSFAYLLTLDGSLTDYPHCTLNQAVATYGRPNGSALIAGSLAHPKELLLFYDRGAHKSAPNTRSLSQGPSTVVPISLQQLAQVLPGLECQSPTIMSVVAHEDDDLLFMNPATLTAIKNGDCVRTVYLTAGDAGMSKFYWLGREQGSQAAYSTMLGTNSLWISRIVRLSNGSYVTVDIPKDNSKIALVFLHIPDGNMKGQGFAATHFESLEKLGSGKILATHTVDSQSTYTAVSLVDSLSELMHLFDPTEIRTQSNIAGTQYIDHSDHRAVGRFVTQAYQKYSQERYGGRLVIPLVYYIGYPGHSLAANVTALDLQQKEVTFLAYAAYDGGVCQSLRACTYDPAYSAYLTRQHTSTY